VPQYALFCSHHTYRSRSITRTLFLFLSLCPSFVSFSRQITHRVSGWDYQMESPSASHHNSELLVAETSDSLSPCRESCCSSSSSLFSFTCMQLVLLTLSSFVVEESLDDLMQSLFSADAALDSVTVVVAAGTRPGTETSSRSSVMVCSGLRSLIEGGVG
jgi:hypothetical protein